MRPLIGYPIRQIRDFVIVEVCVRGEAGWPYDAYRCSYKFQQTAAITCTARGRVIHVPETVIGTSIGQRKCPSVISCRLALDWSCPAPPICGACCAYIAELNESLSSVCCARASLKVAMPAVVVIHAMKEHFNNNCDRRRVIK